MASKAKSIPYLKRRVFNKIKKRPHKFYRREIDYVAWDSAAVSEVLQKSPASVIALGGTFSEPRQTQNNTMWIPPRDSKLMRIAADRIKHRVYYLIVIKRKGRWVRSFILEKAQFGTNHLRIVSRHERIIHISIGLRQML